MKIIPSTIIEVVSPELGQCVLTIKRYSNFTQHVLKYDKGNVCTKVYDTGVINHTVLPYMKQLDYKLIMSTANITRRQLNYYFNEAHNNLSEEQVANVSLVAPDRDTYREYWNNRKRVIKAARVVLDEVSGSVLKIN